MKTELSSLELNIVVKELQGLIEGKVDKVYQPDSKTIVLSLHIPNQGRKNLIAMLPGFLFLSEIRPDNPTQAPGFCMFLRKKLTNARIRAIEQIDSERVVKLQMTTKDNTYYILIELFAKGNFILCDENMKIISLLEPRKMRDRVLRGGVEYDLVKKDYNFFELKKEKLSELIKKEGEDKLVSRLAVGLGLGGVIAEEVLSSTGIDKDAKEISPQKIKKILDSINGILCKEVSAYIVNDDAVPFELSKHKGKHKEAFPTFNSALDNLLMSSYSNQKQAAVKSKSQKKIEKVQKILDEQGKTVNKLESSIEENTKKAELLYTHYNHVAGVLNQIAEARQKMSLQEIADKLKGHKIIKEVNPKEKRIVLELEET